MNIWMMTNTFTPFVGGVARSVAAFADQCRKAGHRVVVVAPVFEGMPPWEEDVIRVPAIQDFNGSDFSLALPAPGLLAPQLEECRPDIVHSHHPHLLGNTAVRIACRLNRPLVFTHHTMYEDYIHYVPTGASRLREFVIALVTGYCNLCDCVIAPSESVASILRDRGIQTPIEILPTGVDVRHFAQGNGAQFRRSHRIPQEGLRRRLRGASGPGEESPVPGGGGPCAPGPDRLWALSGRGVGTFRPGTSGRYLHKPTWARVCTWWAPWRGRPWWTPIMPWTSSSLPRARRRRAWY